MPRLYRPRGVILVRHYLRKRTYSTPDRVLVHLSSEALRPEEQTQDGIAAATRSGRSTLTKWLERLERLGLVVRERVRLPGHPLPKYRYRLTEVGWRAATTLRRRLASEIVTVRAPSLGSLSVRVSEVPSLASARLDLTGALAAVRKGKLDLARAAAPSRARGPLVWGGGLRQVNRFFGRSEELQNLDAWRASDSRVLLMTGLAGIGKSALVAAWVQGRRVGMPVYGFEIRPSSTSAGLLSDFGAFLAALGKPGLASHLAQGVPLDAAFISRLLRRDLAANPILVVLDNVDQMSRDMAMLMNALLPRGEVQLPTKWILLGRRSPRWLSRPDRHSILLEVQQVHGLDRAASRALLRFRGLEPDSAFTGEIIRKTRGHPLLLHLAASTGTGQGSFVQQYLEEEVWSSLTHKDRWILESASVFRKAVGERILEAVANTDRLGLESLVERNLLERTIAGGYTMHDLVREFVVSKMSGTRRARLHARAANLLVRGAEPIDRWEGVYHLIEAGNATRAAELLDSEGAPLLDSLAAEEVASFLRSLVLEETEPGVYCVFAEIIGDSLRIRGHVAPALFQYGHAKRVAESSGQTERIPRLLRKMAFLERCRNRYAKALGYLVEAQARLAQTEDPSEKTDVLRELALAEQALGSFTQASIHLNEAVDLATEMSDRGALSRALLALGSLETRQGHLEQGLDYNLEGLRVAERSGNLTEIAHAHIVVGTVLEELGRLAESLRHHETGLHVARLLGNLRLTAYATLNLTGTLISLARYKEASVALREAEGYFGILEERDAMALLKTYEGQLQMGLGRWSRAKPALEEGLKMLRRYGSPADLALALKESGVFYVDHGEVAAGRRCLQEARGIALKLGNSKLTLDIEHALGSLGTPPVPNAMA